MLISFWKRSIAIVTTALFLVHTMIPPLYAQAAVDFNRSVIVNPNLERLSRRLLEGFLESERLAMGEFRNQMQQLTPGEKRTLNCRVAKVFERRTPLLQGLLIEMAASPADVTFAARLVTKLRANICNGIDASDQKSALGDIFLRADDRLARGTFDLPRGTLVTEMLVNFSERFQGSCFGDTTQKPTLVRLATMSDLDFQLELPDLSFGSCESNTLPQTPGAGAGAISTGGFGTGYSQCVSAAFHSIATKPLLLCDIAAGGGDGGTGDGDGGTGDGDGGTGDGDGGAGDGDGGTGDGDGGTGDGDGGTGDGDGGDEQPPSTEPATDSNTASDVQDIIFLSIGVVGVIVAGASLVGTGGLDTPVALAIGTLSVGLVDRHSARLIDRPRLCPALSTPAGPLTFAAGGGTGGGLGGGMTGMPERRMDITDVMRQCRCENDPYQAFLGDIPGGFGGSSCTRGKELQCLQDAGNDVAGVPDLECRQLLKDQNERSLAAKRQECSVVQCAPDAMISTQCNCASLTNDENTVDLSRIGSPNFGGRCQITCPPGSLTVQSGGGCSCQDQGASGFDGSLFEQTDVIIEPIDPDQ